MATLLSLPNELLQNIASFLPCPSALRLLRVNRQLHRACNDRFVFQHVASRTPERSRLAETGSSLYPTKWLESESVVADASLEDTIRIALAAERCTQATNTKDSFWTLYFSNRSKSHDLSNWLPQMMALRHPAALQMKPEIFLHLQGILLPRAPLCTSMTRTSQTNDLINVNFVMSCTLLSQLNDLRTGPEVKLPFDRFFSINRATDAPITMKDGRRTDGDAIKSLRQRVRGYGEFIAGFDLDQATTLLPTLILELAHHLPGFAFYKILPYPAMMPFRQIMDIPPVFRYNSEEQPFATSHIRKMVSLDFLNGQWIGFNSDQRRVLGRRSFGPPMHMRLMARLPHQGTLAATNIKVIIDSESRGRNSDGEFTLEGQIRDDGLVRLTKRDTAGRHAWLWLGRLTPFGIVGVWGAGHGHFGGYFWIWKEEWCRIH